MTEQGDKKQEAIFQIVFIAVFGLIMTLSQYKSLGFDAVLCGLLMVPIMAAIWLGGRGKLSMMKSWQVALALLGIFLGPFLVMYLVVALMGRI